MSRLMTRDASVGTRWRRKRDGSLWTIRQSHRKDRCAELVADDTDALPLALPARRVFVSFDDLRDRFEWVEERPPS
jgi:hypothetical protein